MSTKCPAEPSFWSLHRLHAPAGPRTPAPGLKEAGKQGQLLRGLPPELLGQRLITEPPKHGPFITGSTNSYLWIYLQKYICNYHTRCSWHFHSCSRHTWSNTPRWGGQANPLPSCFGSHTVRKYLSHGNSISHFSQFCVLLWWFSYLRQAFNLAVQTPVSHVRAACIRYPASSPNSSFLPAQTLWGNETVQVVGFLISKQATWNAFRLPAPALVQAKPQLGSLPYLHLSISLFLCLSNLKRMKRTTGTVQEGCHVPETSCLQVWAILLLAMNPLSTNQTYCEY